jgi:flagellar protein FliO/FliZ
MGVGTVFSSILAVVLALGLVLGLAWGAIWLLKKIQDRQLGLGKENPGRGEIRFLRSLPLGQRERVALIELDGERMLLGVTAGGISMLAHWPEQDKPAVLPDITKATSEPGV